MPETRSINQHGSMFPLSKYTKAFLTYVKENPAGTYLDIGAAFGVTTLPALKTGAHMIANDISQKELSILKQNTPSTDLKNLTTLLGHFPDFDLPAQHLNGILASHILHFLEPDQVRIGIAKMHLWLKPNAKVFVLCFTPYHQFMAKIIPDYEQKISAGNSWPGYTTNSSKYVLEQTILPLKVNLMDPTILAREFIAAQFQIEQVEFTPCPQGINPDFFPLDGREWVGLIARKPS